MNILINLIKIILYPFKFFYHFINNKKDTSTYGSKIIGTGCYLPKNKIDNKLLLDTINQDKLKEKMNKYINKNKKNIDTNLSLDNFITKYYGINSRYKANDKETNSYMASQAILNACNNANISLDEIDLIINASASMDYCIPDTSINIHKLLNLKKPIPCFSVHSTCTSSLNAINIANSFILSKTYKTIVIVASEKTSNCLDSNDPTTYCIFGDLASAIIIRGLEITTNNKSNITNYKYATFCEFSDDIQYDLGMIKHPNINIDKKYYFKLNTFSLKNKLVDIAKNFYKEIFLMDYDKVIIHQPSLYAINHIKQVFGDKKVIETFNDVGNCISASLLYNIHKAIIDNKIKRNDKILLYSMGAGVGIGFCNLIY